MQRTPRSPGQGLPNGASMLIIPTLVSLLTAALKAVLSTPPLPGTSAP